MKKSKVKVVTVEFENRTERFQVDATFSECRNGRKGSELEWTEYHITWVMYDKPKPKPVELIPEHRQEEAWCHIHKMSPGECFEKHYPTAFRLPGEVRSWETETWKDREEKPKKTSVMEEFDLTDLLQGYGNGQFRSNGH